MKKVSLLIAMIAFVCGNAFAQLSFDFDDCPAGAKIAQTLGDPWSTWDGTVGGTADGVFGEAGGSMACHFTYGNDQIVQLGEVSVGVYDLEFDAYVPQGKNGYFNVLHHFVVNGGTGTSWAMQVYMHLTNDGQNSTSAPGHGTVHAGSNGTADLPCVYDQWMHFRVHVDADNDVAQLYFNVVGEPEEMYAEWQWSLDSFGENVADRSLGAMDFFPPQNAANSEYYLDNLSVTLQSNDEELINEPFEEYTVGNKIATEAIAAGHDWWTTWSDNPGSAEDGVVAELDGTQCGHFTYNNDQILLLGDQTSYAYELSFDMYIPTGKDAYNNILHVFNGQGSQWATEVHYKTSSNGTMIEAGGTETNFDCPYDEWFNVKYYIDLDNDLATFYVDDEEIVTWQFSLQAGGDAGIRQLAAADFYPPTSAAVSDYYVDNIVFTKIGGESAPRLSVTPEQVDVTLEEDDMTFVDVTITNDGNSIGDWAGWLDFGQGGAGSQTAELFYHNGDIENASGIGSSSAFTREFGIRLPADAYAGAAMGMKIASVEFFVNTYKSSDNTYIFRLYGQGMNNQPGELLAEKTVNTSVTEQWITATFDEEVYMTGQAMWATIQLEQAEGEYPMTMDGGEYGEEADGNWLSTSGGTFNHCYSAGSFGGAWLINVNCEGELIPATWASINKIEGSVLGGQNDVITLTINTIGLEQGNYAADLVITTNDEALPLVVIPVKLDANYDAVAENSLQIASIYPNPATSTITLEGENLSTVAIYNVAGQLVRIEKLGSVKNTINLDMESGVYFFSVYDNNGNNGVQRVVIVK